MNMLGLCYRHGSHRVPRDLQRARDLFIQAATSVQPTTEAMSNLAQLYEMLGRRTMSLLWLDAAFRHGDATVVAQRDSVRRDIEASGDEFDYPSVPIRCELIREEAMARTCERTKDTPTLAQLESLSSRSSYLHHLYQVRKGIASASDLLLEGEPERALATLGSALRKSDAQLLVAAPSERNPELVIIQALHLLDFPAEFKREVLTLKRYVAVSSMTERLAVAREAVRAYPEDVFFATTLACLLGFSNNHRDYESALVLMKRALTLFPPGDQSVELMDVLYIAATLERKLGRSANALTFYERFLSLAEPFGHRKVPNAYYTMAMLSIDKPKEELESLYWKGRKAEGALPSFLVDDDYPYRNLLALAVGDAHNDDASASAIQVRGGAVLGDLRHELLRTPESLQSSRARSEFSTTVTVWASKDLSKSYDLFPVDPPVSRESREHLGRPSSNPCLIEALVALGQDKVYDGVHLDAIVVSEVRPGPSLMFVVEDGARDAVRVAVYNADNTVLRSLTVGRQVRLYNPYYRLARDGGRMIRVDAPQVELEVTDTQHDLCWTCLEQGSAVKVCTQCRTARYCNQACQRTGWTQLAHKAGCRTWARLTPPGRR
jgi:tetratricopeptide (TPR) repeat protein